MTVLNETTEFFTDQSGIALVVIMIVLVALFVNIYYVASDLTEKAWVFILFALICVGVIILIALVTPTVSKTYKYYDVTFDRTYPAKDLLDEYEIVERRGEIFTIRKEVQDDQADR